MTDATLRQALAFAACGWPVLPCQPGQKIPATRHGYLDATTDTQQITAWFGGRPGWNLAVVTGAPGPDVLDVDQHGPAGNGFPAFSRLLAAGLLDGASTYIRTPSGGLHVYFTGSDQRNAHLAVHHLDFRSAGGYILTPPSQVGGRPYQVVSHREASAGLDWGNVTGLLEPERQTTVGPPRAQQGDVSHLAAWVAALAPDSHNRNDGLFWAACRAAEVGDETVLADLAAAASSAGLSDREIATTIRSARRTTGHAAEHQGGREAAS